MRVHPAAAREVVRAVRHYTQLDPRVGDRFERVTLRIVDWSASSRMNDGMPLPACSGLRPSARRLPLESAGASHVWNRALPQCDDRSDGRLRSTNSRVRRAIHPGALPAAAPGAPGGPARERRRSRAAVSGPLNLPQDVVGRDDDSVRRSMRVARGARDLPRGCANLSGGCANLRSGCRSVTSRCDVVHSGFDVIGWRAVRNGSGDHRVQSRCDVVNRGCGSIPRACESLARPLRSRPRAGQDERSHCRDDGRRCGRDERRWDWDRGGS